MEPSTVALPDVQEDAGTPIVVVGVDGSFGAEVALRYAIEEARRRGASLRVVGAWAVPSAAYMAVPLPIDFSDECERAARTSINRTLDIVGRPTDVPIAVVVTQGQPGAVLVSEGRHADALIVGSRGLGGFRELLLGSVSQACVHHAHCPVIVVPHETSQTSDQSARISATVTA